MYGYAGKFLFVDLSSGTWEEVPFDEEYAKKYIGGYAFGAKFLYDNMPAHTDAYAPESILGFVSGTFNGARAFCAGRYMVVSKSPVNGGWNDANSGGFFGAEMKKAGFDAVFVKGIAKKPVYIFIEDGRVGIRDAAHLWGRTIVDCENALRKEIGDDKIDAALIGPAGEVCSYMAGICNDGHRYAARGGSGGVMGSKKLKALVVRGHQKIELFDSAKMTQISRDINKSMMEGAKNVSFSRFGTGGNVLANVYGGDSSIKNWKSTGINDYTEEKAMKISKVSYDDNYKVSKYSCSCCPIGCGAIYSIDNKKWPMKHVGRPEYEALGGWGPNMLNDDPELIIYCNHLCNEYGFDEISVQNTISWAMECYDEGLLTIEDLNGIDLKWGDADAIVAATTALCKNEGPLAELLRNGSYHAAKKLNAGFEFLGTVGGIEIPQHDPRNSPGYMRQYLANPAPGRHMQGGLGAKDKNSPDRFNFRMTGFRDALETSQDEVASSVGLCKFSPRGYNSKVMKWPMLEAITGFSYSKVERHLIGLRIYMMRQAFNLREGIMRGDFKVNDRLMGIPPLPNGPSAGVTIDADRLVDNFLDCIGCDITGMPRKEMLELIGGLEYLIEDFYPKKEA